MQRLGGTRRGVALYHYATTSVQSIIESAIGSGLSRPAPSKEANKEGCDWNVAVHPVPQTSRAMPMSKPGAMPTRTAG
jgi:hypothetical protein